MPYSIITATGSYIPTVKIPNTHFKSYIFYGSDGKQIEKSNDKIINQLEGITGIKERRYASHEFTTSDLAFFAGEMALQSIDKESLDYIIVAHNYGDVRPDNIRTDIVPSLAARVKHKLKIRNPYTVAYDVLFGCPGWINGLVLADNYIRLGQAKRILVIGAEIQSRVVDPHDMDCMIFADGAGATLIEATEQRAGILSHVTRSDTFDEAFLLHIGKSNNPEHHGDELYIKMDGHEIYKYAVDIVPMVIKQSLDKAGFSVTDVRKFIFHQANEKMDETLLKNLFRLYQIKTIPENVMPMTISWLGNSSVATIPTMIDLIKKGALENHEFNPGDIVVFASVGAGMHVNSIVYKIPEEGTINIEKEKIAHNEEIVLTQRPAEIVMSEDPSRRLTIIEEYLCEQVIISLSKLQSIIEQDVSTNDRLTELNFDSLSAIDFQTNIKYDFGVEMPITLLFGGLTIHELAKTLLESLLNLVKKDSTFTEGSSVTKPISEEKLDEGEI